MDNTSDFPPESYSSSFSLRNEFKEFLISKGLAIFKNGVLTLGPSSKKGGKEGWRPTCCSIESSRRCRQDNHLLKFLALNALELAAPASDVLLRSQPAFGNSTSSSHTVNNSGNQNWFQLSGHPDTFAPAGPGTVWKKCPGGTETGVYEALALEPALRGATPAFYREVQYKGQTFIELQDLLHGFRDPLVMDVKMGTRTFLESEVENKASRHDLYLKMVAVDPNSPTKEEHETQSVTKLRYMTFRDEQSSTCSLGFRIEAMKFRGSPPVTDLQRVKSLEEVTDTISLFLASREDVKKRLAARLHEMKSKLEHSLYFSRHELIGSSILIVYDDVKVGAWLIDFAKTRPVPLGVSVNHRSPWVPGNHEEGFLFGLENLIKVIEKVETSSKDSKLHSKKPLALKS